MICFEAFLIHLLAPRLPYFPNKLGEIYLLKQISNKIAGQISLMFIPLAPDSLWALQYLPVHGVVGRSSLGGR